MTHKDESIARIPAVISVFVVCDARNSQEPRRSVLQSNFVMDFPLYLFCLPSLIYQEFRPHLSVAAPRSKHRLTLILELAVFCAALRYMGKTKYDMPNPEDCFDSLSKRDYQDQWHRSKISYPRLRNVTCDSMVIREGLTLILEWAVSCAAPRYMDASHSCRNGPQVSPLTRLSGHIPVRWFTDCDLPITLINSSCLCECKVGALHTTWLLTGFSRGWPPGDPLCATAITLSVSSDGLLYNLAAD
ncbi:hypothetical protein J6590_018674 [Homalodisca vitripennis]|nr:hypothetical protein J6590_018674 [Homalodisca vitripennis]